MLPHISRLLTEAKSGLQQLYGDRLRGVYLYGSYARNQQHPESDVDLLIVLDKVDHYYSEIKHTSRLIASLSASYEVAVSRVFVPERDWAATDSMFLRSARQEAIAA